MSDVYQFVNPIVRIEEGNLLTQQDFTRLLEAETFQDCLEVLQSTEYKDYIQKEDFTESYATYLIDFQLDLVKKMSDLMEDTILLDLYTLRYTYHNIKLFLKAYYERLELDEYAISSEIFSNDEIKNAIEYRKSSVIDGLYMQAILDVHNQFDQQKQGIAIDIICDRYYLQHLYELAVEIKDEDILYYVQAFIDLSNISMLRRCIIQKRELHFMESILAEHGTLPIKELLLHVENQETLQEYIVHTAYANIVDGTAVFEVARDRYLTNILDKSKYVAFGPLPLWSLLHAQENQLRNVQLILTGKQIGIDSQQIEERMRFYV